MFEASLILYPGFSYVCSKVRPISKSLPRGCTSSPFKQWHQIHKYALSILINCMNRLSAVVMISKWYYILQARPSYSK